MVVELIDKFFNPRSIAIIGASRKPFGAANMILSGILHKKYAGDIYLINNSAKTGETVHNLPLYKSILDCPKVDLAFIIVPGKYVKGVIEECVKKGITNGVIISSGFKESILYDKQKVELEQEIVNIARQGGLRLIGPNCNGIVNSVGLYAFFGPRLRVFPGVCSYVTRGGTAGGFILMGSALYGRGLGVNKLVNIGDACDLQISDFIQYYDQDPQTKVIGVYTEGITDGANLLEILRNVKKPVIFYKSGQTSAGLKAAMSHVGAIASDKTNSIYRGFISQAGVVPANSVGELLDLAAALSHSVLPSGNKVAIFTFGGSLGVMMSDAAEKYGLNVASLKTSQIEMLNKILPEYWSHSNPIDVTDGGSVYEPRTLIKVFAMILEEFDALFIITPVFENDEIFDYAENETNFRLMFRQFIKQNIRHYNRLTQSGKPIFVLGEYGEISDLFYKHGIPVYESFEQITRTYARIYSYSKILKMRNQIKKKIV